MLKQIFLGVIGLSGGLVVAGGVIALLVGLGVITRFIGLIREARRIWLFEDAIILGSLFGNWLTIFAGSPPLGLPGLFLLGVFSGIFVGGWIMALAEIVNIFPVMARRIGLVKGMSIIVIAMALGKTIGSLLQFMNIR